MQLTPLPSDWTPTRMAVQAHAQAVTAFPRAAAPRDPGWSHVAMDPHTDGFATWPVVLEDGAELVSVLDLEHHTVRATAGDDSIAFDLTSGPTAREVGESILALAMAHGFDVDVDRARFGTGDPLTYDPAHAAAFLATARFAVDALDQVNATLDGEVAGPHLWPHGFDIATEWFSEQTVTDGDSGARAQIVTGWYPADVSYVYVNPWPFRDEFESVELPGRAVWHLDGWQGARLDIGDEGVPITDVVDLGVLVHDATSPALGT